VYAASVTPPVVVPRSTAMTFARFAMRTCAGSRAHFVESWKRRFHKGFRGVAASKRTHSPCRPDCPNSSAIACSSRAESAESPVKKIFANERARGPRWTGFGANRANRVQVIRAPCVREDVSEATSRAAEEIFLVQTTRPRRPEAEKMERRNANSPSTAAQMPSLLLSSSFTTFGLALPADAFIT
jgi:hypothetical protein